MRPPGRDDLLISQSRRQSSSEVYSLPGRRKLRRRSQGTCGPPQRHRI